MAVIKQISIHNSPKKFLKYILDTDKTKGELVSAFNTIPTVDFANNSLKKVFNQYYNNRYGEVNWDYTKVSDGEKHAIKVHHFIQSFSEGSITPELAIKMGNLNKKITDLSNQISQYDELKSISEIYLKFADMPMSKMTILDTINRQKAEVILFKHSIHNKQELIERLETLEDVKHNYNIFQHELKTTTKEYRKYIKLIN